MEEGGRREGERDRGIEGWRDVVEKERENWIYKLRN